MYFLRFTWHSLGDPTINERKWFPLNNDYLHNIEFMDTLRNTSKESLTNKAQTSSKILKREQSYLDSMSDNMIDKHRKMGISYKHHHRLLNHGSLTPPPTAPPSTRSTLTQKHRAARPRNNTIK